MVAACAAIQDEPRSAAQRQLMSLRNHLLHGELALHEAERKERVSAKQLIADLGSHTTPGADQLINQWQQALLTIGAARRQYLLDERTA